MRHPGEDENAAYRRRTALKFVARRVHLRTGLLEGTVVLAAGKFARTGDLIADPIQNRDRSDLFPIFGALDAQGFTAELVVELARLGIQIKGTEKLAKPPKEKLACHSRDFRSVHRFGVDHSFTANQAACVKLWWEEWEKLTPEVSDATVIETADISSDRLSVVFRNHPAWGTMIQPGQTKGTHRLVEPTL